MPTATQRLLPPDALARLANVNLVARWVVEGFIGGLHQSPFHGSSVEFAEYRPYVPGDDLRHFDWKALGKSDKRYIKKFRSETNLKSYLMLDCSASMGYGTNGLTKLRYAACLTAALAHVMIRQQDAVGVVLFADRLLRYIAPRAGPRHLRDLTTVLEAARPTGSTRIQAMLHHMAESIKRRGLIVLLSDLYDEPEAVLKGLKHFRHRKHDVILFHLLDPAELALPFSGLADFQHLETGEKLQVRPLAVRAAYREALTAFIENYRRACADRAIDYQLVDTSVPFDRFLNQYLTARVRKA
ncbi:MAG: DUF58 domain-containing protein [Planctomycetes bacterium]|nr:DUF58 domain-containing protein [Planctomycetota bacterium]